jgi:hypothetical protein
MRLFLLASMLAAMCFAGPGDDAPQMTSASAKNAKPGDIIDISGLGLGSKAVDEVYLTDHKFDMKVKLLEQNDKLIKFRVPPFAKPGRVQLLMLTTGDTPQLLEEPVYILIEEPSTEVGQVTARPAAPAPAEKEAAAPSSAQASAAPAPAAKEEQRDKQQ